jgi:hypothetical protein
VSETSKPAQGPSQPFIHWVLGARSRGLKWPRHGFDASSPCSAEVMNGWRWTSTLSYAFIACTGTTLLPYTRTLGMPQLLLDQIILAALTVFDINLLKPSCNFTYDQV